MGSEHYCLRWNNHQSNLLGVFSQLLQDESLVDVTLACSEGASIRAHKVVLSACSSYFQSLFLDHPSRHPIVILKDVQFAELRTLVEFMYKGEVNVQYCQLSALLKTAESLKVKGLAEMTNLNSGAGNTEVGGGEADALQPQDLTPTRTGIEQHVPERLVREESSPPRASPLMHVRRNRHDRYEPRHGQEIRDRHEARSEIRHERQEGRHEARLESRHEARHEQEHEPGGTDGRHEAKHELRQEMKQEPHHEPPARDPGGKEEPPDEPMWTSSPEDDLSSLHSNCGHSDNIGLNMSINTNNNNSALMSSNPLELRLGLGRSISGEPIAGPSGLPPVQQVPLSLKKEMDWNRLPDDKSGGESSSEYRHPLHESESFEGGAREGDGRVFPCMYCGAGFPHQSKLTRHILSHSLETLKYREAVLGRALPPLPLGEPAYLPVLPPPDDHPLDMELVAVEPGNVVLCKFCGKSFPDVSSLIAHLPVHTGDRPFKCEFCGKAFKLRHHMKDHCRVHTGERPFRCALCGKTFSRSTILKAHEKTHYPKYVRKFLSPSPLDTEEESPHLTVDSSPGSSRSGTPLGPPMAGPALGWPGALLALLQRRALHHLLPPPPLHPHPHSLPYLEDVPHRCPACYASFPSAWLLERHAALQHPPGPDEKPFVCEQCGQSYRYRSAYVKHREQNHRARLPADKLFTCDVCGMQFRYLKSFKKHRLNHALERIHGKSGESRSRDSSDHVSSTNDTLLGRSGEMDLSLSSFRREPSVTDPEDSDTEFRRTSQSREVDEIDQDDTVDSVVPTNTSENLTAESDCEKGEGESTSKPKSPAAETAPKKPETSFANISSMADSSVVEKAGSSGLQPDSSDKPTRDLHPEGSLLGASMLGVATSEASLLSYLRADSADRQRERRFACPFCGKCVRSKENLKLHVRKHTGERPFVCLFCGRAFGGKSDLTRHLRIHTGERPYHCEACGKCFARADYLSKHLTTHIHNPR